MVISPLGRIAIDHCTLCVNALGPDLRPDTEVSLTNTSIACGISISFFAPGGIVKMDSFTYHNWLSPYAHSLVNGTIEITDSPLDGYHIPLGYTPVNYAAPVDDIIGEHIARIDRQLGLNAPSASVYTSNSTDVSLTALANVLIDTRPASPSGAGRWKLISIDIRVKVAISGSGSPSSIISVGSTSGGQQIVINQTVDGYKTVGTIVGGLALNSLGSDMSQSNGFEAVYPASQQMYANITPSGSPATGTVTIYLVWQELS